MTVFDSIKNKNIDELVDWIDEHFDFDNAPYWRWWDENYCKKCEPIETGTNVFGYPLEHAYCEVYGNCKFFKDMKEIPNSKQTIKMWLESEGEKICPNCKHFVGCECFDGKICDRFD